MSDNLEKYRKAIQLLSENEFNDFVKLYNKVYYGTEDVVDTNGPYDAGIDLSIHVNGRQIKKVVQITVQKTDLEKKIMGDIAKAVKNVKRNGFSRVIDYYLQEGLTNEVKNRVTRNALIQSGIEVSIYDCRRLAELVESETQLRSFLFNRIDVAFSTEDLSLDSNTKLFFDAVSQQQDIRDIKQRVIESCLLSYIYSEGEVDFEKLFSWLDKLFCGRIARSYYEDLVGRLNGKEIHKLSDTNPIKYCLSEETKHGFEELEFKSKQKEAELINAYKSVCSRYGVTINIGKLSTIFLELYKDIFAFDSAEIMGKNIARSQTKLEKCKINFIRFLESEIGDRPEISVPELCAELMSVFESNDLYGKYAASQTFIQLFNDDKLDKYLSQSPRYLLLDTPVLLQFICLIFKKSSLYTSPNYQAVVNFRSVIDESKVDVHLYTTKGYLKEVVVHLRQAIRLERFIHLPAFKDIGKSNNVFYNFFESVLSNSDYASLSDFVCEVLDLSDIPTNDDYLENCLFTALEERLSILHVTIDSAPDTEDYMQEYEYAMSNTPGENKSSNAKIHDLEAILYLSQKMPSNDTYPYLITWDKTFLTARRHFQKKYPELSDWYLYSPQNFTSTLSVLQFKLNSSMITQSVMSVIEENVNSSSDALNLLDTINSFVQGESDRDIEFANRILYMRRALMQSSIEDEDSSGVAIGDLLSTILRSFAGDKDKYEIVVLLFSDKIYSELMRSIIVRYVKDFRSSDKIKVSKLMNEINELVDSVEIDE